MATKLAPVVTALSKPFPPRLSPCTIIDCRLIAEGVITAAKNVGLRIPLAVRLKGTKNAEAQKFMQAFAEANKDNMNISVVSEFNTNAADLPADKKGLLLHGLPGSTGGRTTDTRVRRSLDDLADA